MDKIIPAAFILDLIIGDPKRPTHPVALMGQGITSFESVLRKVFRTASGLKFAGVVLWTVMVSSTYIITYSIIVLLYRANIWLGHAASLWLTYTTFAVKDLVLEAKGIYHELRKGREDKAALLVARIVGRDTDNLPAREIVRATVETVAENTVDGIIAPIFYAFLGGPALAMAFKAASTLDSMVGNKSDRYFYLGWCSARMDDVLNYIPARVGGLLMITASAIMGFDGGSAIRTVVRDAKKHKSPNSGIPEAITAGALGIRLGGYNYYSGIKEFRAYMGEKTRETVPDDIVKVITLCVATSVLTLLIGEILYIIFS